MINKKYVFVGNRFNVLKQMFESNLNIIKIYAVQNSFLEKELISLNIAYEILDKKDIFFHELKNLDFEVLVSNGCPYVIPVSAIKKNYQVFVNVHPSLLPDLKGRTPVNGAFLFNRNAGATCHLMDDGIDTGPIVEQVQIELTGGLDLGLLYKLSFRAEQDVFKRALSKNFVPSSEKLAACGEYIYYTRKDEDLLIDFPKETADKIISKIKAFGIQSQGAYFIFNNETFKVLDAEIVTNNYLLSNIEQYKDLEVAYIYEKNILLRKDNVFLKLKNVQGNLDRIKEQDIIV